MIGWLSDKKWSDKFIPEIKYILSDIFVCAAPEHEDQLNNTDLMVFMMKPARVACRIRRFEYLQRYPNDITIRKNRPSGKESELAKLISGFGDYLFYGFSNEDETAIKAYTLIDLSKFRLWFTRYIIINNGTMPGKEQTNGDKSSRFQSFNKNIFHDGIILKEKK